MTGLAAMLLAPSTPGSLATAAETSPSAPAESRGLAVSALGRIEPDHGIVRLGLSSIPDAVNGAVLRRVMVEAGDDVTESQVLAESDAARSELAVVALANAQQVLAEREADMAAGREEDACARADVARRTSVRRENLLKNGATSNEEADVAAGDARALSGSCASARNATKASAAAVDVARARVAQAEAELDRCFVKAPFAGRVLRVIRRPGEMVDAEGVLELARVSRMFAIAEVYETDIRRVHKGQKATVTSSALDGPLDGVVDQVRLKVRKQDATGTDPAARKDARIVEVEVLLDHPEKVAALTNLQVEVVLHP